LKLQLCLKALEHSESRCIVIATTQNPEFIAHLKLADTFNEKKGLSNIVLQFNQLAECQKTIVDICKSLGHEVKVRLLATLTPDASRQIEMPIRELVYQIKKFIFQNKNKTLFDLDEFYRFTHSKQQLVLLSTHRQRLTADLSVNEDSDDEEVSASELATDAATRP